MRSGVIYFLLSEIHNAVKIGFTCSNIEERLKDYRNHSPYEYDLLKTIKGTMFQEKQLHKRFVRYKIRGEWFNYSDELKEFIEEIVSEGLPPQNNLK